MRALLAVLAILTAVPTFSFQLGAPRTLAHAAVVRSGRPVLDETETAEQQSIVTFSERAMQQLEGMRKNCPDGQLILRMGGMSEPKIYHAMAPSATRLQSVNAPCFAV